MSSFSINLCIIVILILYEHSQSQSLCYELASSDCHSLQTKQCSIWNTDITNQCICIMNAFPIDIYFLLDSTNIDIDTWQNILLSIPLSFLHKCSSHNTNNYIIQYTNNQTNIVSNPSISQLSTLTPIHNGIYSSFCNTLHILQQHILSKNTNNPILLVIITGNNPHDITINNQCNIQLIPELQDIYGIYFNDIQSDTYESILSYHKAFQINDISEIRIITDLITATLCDYAYDISSNAQNPPTISTSLPASKPIAVPSKPTYFKPWGKAWYVGRWDNDKKEYDKYKKKKSHKRSSSSSSDSSSSSSNSDKSDSVSYKYGYTGFGWNRYQSHKHK